MKDIIEVFSFKNVPDISPNKNKILFLNGIESNISIQISDPNRQTLSDVLGFEKTWNILLNGKVYGIAHGETNAMEAAIILYNCEKNHEKVHKNTSNHS